MIRNYDEAVAYISETSWKDKKKGLERIGKLCALLGNPQDGLSCIHIAGTNGKGSTAAILDSVCRSAGLTCGLFTSPHLEKYNERIRVNGVDIGDDEFVSIASTIEEAAQKMEDAPTVFEKLTVMGFIYFAQKNCDVVILETGMGGEFDSTNIIENPIMTVITNIGLDHTAELGDTLDKIALTKAGIVKKGVPCVSIEQSDEVMNVIRTICMFIDSPCVFAKKSDVRVISSDFNGIRIMTSSLSEPVTVSLCGEYQISNIALALSVIRLLMVTGKLPIDESDVLEGLRNVSWAARFEIMKRNPYLIVDGAHNPHGMRGLVDSLKKLFLTKQISYITAINKDKDVDGILDILSENALRVYTVKVDPRGAEAEELAEKIKSRGINAIPCESVKMALENAFSHSDLNDIVCCAGSLYLSGDVRKLIKENGVKWKTL
ncbi:MAG: bifunctional folylpolyglutamate synthase/dihydrofolate synthase [Lachnospiraceae bacterium]|nr:bifunctional folylpolyglutamate synthase/dihydrofolate synthase [Lachnospiraceae bacterium]